jgi:hypothetical protein
MTAEVIKHHKDVIARADQASVGTVNCPFCEGKKEKVQLGKFGLHCWAYHRLRLADLKTRLPFPLLSTLTEYQQLADKANYSRSALKYRKGNGHDKAAALPTVIPQQMVTATSTTEPTAEQLMAEQMGDHDAAVRAIHTTSVMIQCATLMNRYGPEQMMLMLQGLSRMGSLVK